MTGGLRVQPHVDFATSPGIDVLVIPGGFGTRQLFDDVDVRDWIRQMAARAQLTTSVCTGALLLARAGLLSHRRATTHWGALDLLRTIDQTTTRRASAPGRPRRRLHFRWRRRRHRHVPRRRRIAVRPGGRRRDGEVHRVPPRSAVRRVARLPTRSCQRHSSAVRTAAHDAADRARQQAESRRNALNCAFLS